DTVGGNADLDPASLQRLHVGGRQILLAEMNIVGAQLECFAPVVVHNELAIMPDAHLHASRNLLPNILGGSVLDAQLNGADPKRHDAIEPSEVRHNWIEGIEPPTCSHGRPPKSKNGVPATGVDGWAISRISINPASSPVRPASIAAANALASCTGSPALATAVFSSTAS